MTTITRERLIESVRLPLSVTLHGDIVVPAGATSLIIFAHGSGSGRASPRNQWVASQLQEMGLATLLFDLLTEEEDRARSPRFDIALLAQRLVEAAEWAESYPRTRGMRLGIFGASTGAAAAVICGAARPDLVRAIVSRGGRPDLASEYLRFVVAPTRLVVGELDREVIALNRSAMARLGTSTRDLVIVPGATHLFEEPGTLARVATLASDWFRRYVGCDPVVNLDDEC